MTNKDRNQGNKLIAEFMGYEYFPHTNPYGHKRGWWKKDLKGIPIPARPFFIGDNTNDLQYHNDWNWFMGACNKWDTLPEFKSALASQLYVIHCEELDNLVTCYQLEPAYHKLIACIDWYNNVT